MQRYTAHCSLGHDDDDNVIQFFISNLIIINIHIYIFLFIFIIPGRHSVRRDTLPTARSVMMMIMRMMRMAEVMIMMMINSLAIQ